MAQRAAGFAKKPPASRANRVISPRSAGNSPVTLRPIELNLKPLLAPYKKRGRLSLRIERLPQFARLSAGRNRGDGTWSLASDELEDLTYLIPETLHDAHTLGIRIISLDGGEAGTTLALLDYVVSPGSFESDDSDPDEAETDAAEEEPEPTVAGVELGDLALLHRLRGELSEARGTLAAREPELTKPHEPEPPEPEPARDKTEAKLAAARLVWKAELDERLAVAAQEAAAALAKARQEWEAEHATRAGKGGKTEADLAKARNVWKAELEKRLAEASAQAAADLAKAREGWDTERNDDLAKARELWDAERNADLARHTRAESGKGESAKAKVETELAKARAAWTEELDKRLAEAAERAAAELAAAREAWEQERAAVIARQAKTESAKGKIEDELTAARAEWKADLEERLAAASTDAAAMLVRSKKAWEAEQAALVAQTERAAEALLADERGRLQREAQEALANAEAGWKAQEAERFTAAEATWQEDNERALAAAYAEAVAERKQLADNEIRPLREKILTLEADVAARETALAKAGLDTEEARQLWQRDSAEALTKAEMAAKAIADDAAAKLAEVEARWKEKAARDQAAAEALLEEANAALKATWAKTTADVDAVHAQAAADVQSAQAQAEAESLSLRARAAADAVAARAKADEEQKVLRDEIANLKLTMAEREGAFELFKQEAAAKFAKADEDWKTSIDARVEEVETRFKRQYSGALAEATSRAEAAETALALIRHRAARDHNDHSENLDVLRLRDEMSVLQRELAAREKELHELRGPDAGPVELAAMDPKIALRTNQAWRQVEAIEQERRAKVMRLRVTIWGGAGAAIAAAVAGIVIFTGGSDAPEPLVAAEPMEAVAGVGVGEHSTGRNLPVATVERDSNVRSGPSTTSAVVAAVKHGMSVAIIGKQNNWRHIRFGDDNGTAPKEGWIHNSRLKEEAPSDPVPRAAETE